MLESRYKIVRVRYNDVIEFFNFHSSTPEFIRLPYFPELPPGYKVVDVRHEWMAKCLEFRVYHDSWDIVPDGMIFPIFGADTFIRVDFVRVVRQGNDEAGAPLYVKEGRGKKELCSAYKDNMGLMHRTNPITGEHEVSADDGFSWAGRPPHPGYRQG